MKAGTLIVGASQAGVQVAASLRDAGHDGPITLVGAESHPPYQRPPLSKELLSGAADVTSLALRTDAFYATQRIDVVRGERISEVELTRTGPPGSGTARTASGRTLEFDRLALTVGSRPRRLAVAGADLDGVCYLRDVEDALRLRARLAAAHDVVVIGGGFIGLEAAAVAGAAGKTVTVVEAADRLIARAVAPVVSDFFRLAHVRRGTDVRLGVGVARVEGNCGRVSGVTLTDGTVLPADVVVVGIGVVPRTELAEQLGLDCQRGIVVDRFARTSEPNVVAAGDCTVLPDPVTGEGLVCLESMPNAVAQARVAAGTLAGELHPYADVPWFWSDQYDLKLQMAGVTNGYDRTVVRGMPGTEQFAVLYYRGGTLLGVNAVNRPADYLAVRKALGDGTEISPEMAADPDVPLKTLLRAAVA